MAFNVKVITTEVFDSTRADHQEVIRYYATAGLDYEPWSPQYNMHFGYFRPGVNPFRREALLEEMNAQVLQRLQLDSTNNPHLVDLGCGVGATARYCVVHQPNCDVTGVTVVQWQIDKARSFNKHLTHSKNLHYELADYCAMPFTSGSFDGAYAIESSCYAPGEDKRAFIDEAFRVLKPGARLVIADGFRKCYRSSRLFEKAYQSVCNGWFLGNFAHVGEFTRALGEAGFVDIKVQEASWRVLPSVLYVPWVSLSYSLKLLLTPDTDKKLVQKRHLMAPLMGLVIGMHRRSFGYYIVSACKPA